MKLKCECGKKFEQRRSNQRHCSAKCRGMAAQASFWKRIKAALKAAKE